MSLSTLILSATRRVHRIGVKLHCQALGNRVRAANRAADRATDQHRAAMAITNAARVAEQEAKGKAHKASTLAHYAAQAAQAEAQQIGGAL
ncbi:hypothetical protein CAL26_21225 [Bordetella genomosp. 9]|uniref:Uncharacterized protein n=1 Tax=Bordetella genomosp. 9 TaxID=1416803 RepID=A0A261R4Y7_9BORD|nr:hypothetical protein [Bordetella genomosp. 9]OZI20079.1 hypothetical protein CAL26_21225 [Bordetella genomosp. 9]